MSLENTETLSQFCDSHFILAILEFHHNRTGRPDVKESLLELARGLGVAKLMMAKMKIDIGVEDNFSTELMNQREEYCRSLVTLEQHIQGKSSRSLVEWNQWWKGRHTTAGSPEVPEEEASASTFHLPDDVLSVFMKYVEMLYAAGYYKQSFKWASFAYQVLMTCVTEAKEPEFAASVYWAILASANSMALTSNASEVAKLTDVGSIVLKLDNLLSETSRHFSPQVLMRKLWLLHWAFIWALKHYLPQMTSRAKNATPIPHWQELLEFLFSERNSLLIVRFAPHLLRYLTIIGVFMKGRTEIFRHLLEVVQQKAGVGPITDPFPRFIEGVRLKCEFSQAQTLLREVRAATQEDMLLASMSQEVEEEFRLFLFETFCRTYQTLDMTVIAERLGMESAETWIADLIRRTRLNAQIDSVANQVQISTEPPNLREAVFEKAIALKGRPVGTRTHG